MQQLKFNNRFSTDKEYLKKYFKGNLEEAYKKLEEGIPVQYIVGNMDFYGYCNSDT